MSSTPTPVLPVIVELLNRPVELFRIWDPQVFVRISLNFDTWFVKSRGYNAGRTIGLVDRAMRG